MSGNYFSRIYDFIQARKSLVFGLLGIGIVFSIIGLKFVKYNNNIELMLPRDVEVQNIMRFLREANFSDKLIISLKLKDQKHTTQDLIAASDGLAAAIKSPLVTEVLGSVSTSNVMSEMTSFMKYTPQLLGPESLAEITARITESGVKDRLKFVYRQSLAPGSSFMMPFLRADPLGISSGILRSIEKLSTASGYDVVINNGHLISRDGRHAMIILKTPVVLTEGFGSRKLITYLKEELKRLPDFVSADIIAGHMHTVSNEEVIKRDIRLTSIIATVVFLLLFLFFFRDLRAVIIFFIPLAAVAVATNVTYWFFNNLSYFVIGMGTVIAGIADDYAIYVYMAVRKGGGGPEVLSRVIKPVIFGALTTISVFAVFFFSSVKGYNQLAFFSNFSIVLCLLFSLFILPLLLKKEKRAVQPSLFREPASFSSGKVYGRVWIWGWVLLMAVMVISATGLRFNNDITQFDGVGKEIISAEDDFHNAWGGKVLPAIFVVSSKSLEDAYQVNSQLYEAAIKTIGKDNFVSFASVWPGSNSRKANLSRWQEFWSADLENNVKKMLGEYGREYKFSPNAFQPFFEQLHSAGDLEIEPKGFTFFNHLKEQFVIKKEDGYQIVSFFPDQDKYITQLSAISNNYPGSFVVSRKNFSNTVARALSSELVFLSLLAVFLIVALTFILLKDIRLAALALVPVLTSVIMIIGIIPLAGLAFNMPSIIASLVVVGLVSDYGMFVVYYCKNKFQTGTYQAVTLAAATTLVGAGVLLFAHHPVMFSIGVTLVTGVLSGYISSLLVIPPLYRLWITEKD